MQSLTNIQKGAVAIFVISLFVPIAVHFMATPSDKMTQYYLRHPMDVGTLPYTREDWTQTHPSEFGVSQAPNPAQYTAAYQCSGGRLVNTPLDCPPGEQASLFNLGATPHFGGQGVTTRRDMGGLLR